MSIIRIIEVNNGDTRDHETKNIRVFPREFLQYRETNPDIPIFQYMYL